MGKNTLKKISAALVIAALAVCCCACGAALPTPDLNEEAEEIV